MFQSVAVMLPWSEAGLGKWELKGQRVTRDGREELGCPSQDLHSQVLTLQCCLKESGLKLVTKRML